MGVNCCCTDKKEAPEIVIVKPERNINLDSKNPKNSQVQNDFIVVNSTQNSQNLRSSSPEYEQNMYQSYQNTQSMSPQSNINYLNVEYQYSPQVNQSTAGIIPNYESNNIIYENQNLDQNNRNIQTQSIVSQNENIITNNQSSIVIPQQIINSTQGALDTNYNQYNPQVDSQVVTMSQNISNQYVNDPFKLGLFTNDNPNTNPNNNPLGFNKNEVDNIFDFKSLGFPGNDTTSNSQNINNQQINYISQNQQPDANVNFEELLKQQIDQQQSSNGGNGLNIDELLKQQNNQQHSGAADSGININDLLNSQNNNQQTGMGLNMDELLKQQNNQINDLFFENQNGLNIISKSMQLSSPYLFQKNINNQRDPLLYSLNPPKPINVSTSIQLDQLSPFNSQIKKEISEPLSPSNQYNNNNI